MLLDASCYWNHPPDDRIGTLLCYRQDMLRVVKNTLGNRKLVQSQRHFRILSIFVEE